MPVSPIAAPPTNIIEALATIFTLMPTCPEVYVIRYAQRLHEYRCGVHRQPPQLQLVREDAPSDSLSLLSDGISSDSKSA